MQPDSTTPPLFGDPRLPARFWEKVEVQPNGCWLWREIGGPRWPYWSVKAAIAYSQNVRHPGNIYRFDGWEKITDRAGSGGGGAWSRKRYAGNAALGPKTLWLWRYA